MKNKPVSSSTVVLIAIIMIIGLFLMACATPVGQLEKDLIWTRTDFDSNYQAVYRNLKDGFRKCGSDFHIQSELYTDIKQGRIDIYLQGIMGMSRQFVFGVIDIECDDSENGSMLFGVNDSYEKLGRRMNVKFASWARGDYECE